MNMTTAFSRIYSGCMRLFPAGFREEYGPEMQSVFSQACHDARRASPASVWMLALRELRDLPASLAREYLSEIKRGIIFTPPVPPESLPRSARRGLLIFGTTFGLIYLVFCLVDTLSGRAKSLVDPASAWNAVRVMTWMPAAIGAGVAWLGFRANRRRAVSAGLAIFALLFVFYRLWSALVSPFYFPSAAQPQAAISPAAEAAIRIGLSLLEQTLTGLIAAGALAWVHQEGRHRGWSALACVAGFNLAFLCTAAFWNLFMLQYGYGRDLTGISTGSFEYFAYWLVTHLPAGLVIGAFLGMALGKQAEKLPSPSLA